MLKYYFKLMKWIYKHRLETNNRQKWRRMAREIGE